jgi:hypothetical protein
LKQIVNGWDLLSGESLIINASPLIGTSDAINMLFEGI